MQPVISCNLKPCASAPTPRSQHRRQNSHAAALRKPSSHATRHARSHAAVDEVSVLHVHRDRKQLVHFHHQASSTFSLPGVTFEQLAADLHSVSSAQDKAALLLGYGKTLPPFPAEDRTIDHRVMGCAAQVWMTARLDEQGMVQLAADSDSAISKGLAAILVHTLSGRTPRDILEVRLTHI